MTQEENHNIDNTEHSLQTWSSIQSLHKRELIRKVDRNKTAKSHFKQVASKSTSVARSGINLADKLNIAAPISGIHGVTSIAAHAATKGAVGAGVAALSATGVGLVIVGGVVSVVKSGFSGVSAYKTHNHLLGLVDCQKKYSNANNSSGTCLACEGGNKSSSDHEFIASIILPRIIEKKRLKFSRKVVGVVPMIGGMFVNVETGFKNIFKRATGRLGVKRHHHADVLAKHLVTHHCQLAQDIVSELYSYEEMVSMMYMDSAKAGKLICEKMRSK